MNPSNYCMLNRKSIEEAVDVAGYGHILTNNLSYAREVRENISSILTKAVAK